ncbi:MAG: phosphosulfolactate synthase [Bacteroidetes bacterium]|nr:MAG: phosphosulfolactate synthase [Bacteroidota bacterium]REK00018.1 MAG: phosphosulfolactate synthase [Bacteroidota bacterium]REK35802.1 MAG: phosphosulfolactate synthase [Bacteroidota bacterium]REK49326.1 MAG: phosphosulfolactate synthase [Bacteroidota bacterium]
MNFSLEGIPKRTVQPRDNGLTMVMDKGLSVRQAEDLMDSASKFIDLVKLGFGSALITNHLEKKISIYRSAGVPVYFGGTLWEAFQVRNKLDDYLRLLEKYKMTHAEISDGSITIPHKNKLEYIRNLSKHVTVISEVGSKEEGIIIHPAKWIEMMKNELDAGAWKVIAEARESGTVGIYRPSGKAHVVLINKIIAKVPPEKIIWETPNKSGQTYFIKLLGANANLGNIAPAEIIAVESLRLGLRSDTFMHFIK